MDTSDDAFGGLAVSFLKLALDVVGHHHTRGDKIVTYSKQLEEMYWQHFDSRDLLSFEPGIVLRIRPIRLPENLRPISTQLSAFNHLPVKFGLVIEANAHLAAIKFGQSVLDALWSSVDEKGY